MFLLFCDWTLNICGVKYLKCLKTWISLSIQNFHSIFKKKFWSFLMDLSNNTKGTLTHRQVMSESMYARQEGYCSHVKSPWASWLLNSRCIEQIGIFLRLYSFCKTQISMFHFVILCHPFSQKKLRLSTELFFLAIQSKLGPVLSCPVLPFLSCPLLYSPDQLF